MKYKVGDRVRVRKDLEVDKLYGDLYFRVNMSFLCGKIVTISEVRAGYYHIDGYYAFVLTDSMLEPITELTASEVIVFTDYMCAMHDNCVPCPVYKIMKKYNCSCLDVKLEHTDEFIDTVTKWVAGNTDEKKKEIRIECGGYAVIMDANRNVVYEERLKPGNTCSDVLKRYCEAHDGTYYAVREHRAVVKES